MKWCHKKLRYKCPIMGILELYMKYNLEFYIKYNKVLFSM